MLCSSSGGRAGRERAPARTSGFPSWRDTCFRCGRGSGDGVSGNLLATHLLITPALPGSLTPALSPPQAIHLLTVLTRATTHTADRDQLSTLLTSLCVDHPDVLARPAIDVATQTEHPQPLLDALEQITDHPDTSAELLTELSNRLPHSSHNLARWAARLTQALTDHFRTQAHDDNVFLPDLAGSLNNLAVRLGDLGRREDALAAIEEAVTAYRQLHDRNPSVHRVRLEQSLRVQSWLEADGGQR